MLYLEGVFDRNDALFGWESLLGDRCGGPDVSNYSRRLSEAGVRVDLRMWGAAFLVFTTLAPDTAISRAVASVTDACIRSDLTS